MWLIYSIQKERDLKMNPEVSTFIENLSQPWQVEVADTLRKLVHEVIPDVEERIQYKKPHFLKNGHYAAVISPSKDALTFMIMNTTDLEFPKHFGGPGERRWLKMKEGDTVDYDVLRGFLKKASSTL